MSKKEFNKVKRKIRKLVKKEFTVDSSELISKIGDTYLVYDSYQIVHKDNKFDIYEKVKERRKNQLLASTFKSASAILWCIAKHNDENELAKNLENYDKYVEYILHDIMHTKSMLKVSTNANEQAILLSKLHEFQIRHTQLKSKLHKYIQRAKYIKKKSKVT